MTRRAHIERAVLNRRQLFGMACAVGAGAAGSALALPRPAAGTLPTDPSTADTAGPGVTSGGTYRNPVSLPAAENFPDMSTIRGRDGYWYMYSTAGPMFPGDRRHRIKILRSPDLVDWTFAGDAFTEENEPTWGFRGMLGPAIRYFGGRYVMYYRWNKRAPDANRGWASCIGVATAPAPTGPWTDKGEPLVPPQKWEPWPGREFYQSIIGPEQFTGPDGSHYLYYGSRGGGVWGAKLSDDGLTVVSEPTRITPPLRYEGPFVMHHDGWYYLFLSAIGGCCFGPASTYGLYAGRARHPLGPFVDADGYRIDANNAGGTRVLTLTGNEFVGVGHNVVTTDLAGQHWAVYHGFDRFHPYLFPGEARGDRRSVFIDRLDWIDDWPIVNGGRGASSGAVPAPVTTGFVADSFEASDEVGDAWVRNHRWRIGREPEGRYVVSDPAAGEQVLFARTAVAGDLRARASVRLADGSGGAGGLLFEDRAAAGGARVFIDRGAGALTVEVQRDATATTVASTPLPDRFDHLVWHELAVTVRSGTLRAEVTHGGLYDPLAIVEAPLPDGLPAGRFGLAARGGSVAFDDVTVARLFIPSTDLAADPEVGELDSAEGEEFTGPLSGRWSWVRSPAATVEGGQLVFPLQRATLVDRYPDLGHNNASVLLRDPPAGEWTVETRVTIPFGEAIPKGFPQAGLIVYQGDDDYILHTYSGRTVARWVGFGREMTYQDRVLYAWTSVGPTADTVHLRLKHTISEATGEHLYQAAHSLDGETWYWHHVYTMPADWSPRIGFAGFDAHESYHAYFDHLRFYKP